MTELPPPTTREEFDKGLNEEAKAGLQMHRTKYTGLIQLSKAYQRPDLVAIFETLRKGIDEAIAVIEAIETPKPGSN